MWAWLAIKIYLDLGNQFDNRREHPGYRSKEFICKVRSKRMSIFRGLDNGYFYFSLIIYFMCKKDLYKKLTICFFIVIFIFFVFFINSIHISANEPNSADQRRLQQLHTQSSPTNYTSPPFSYSELLTSAKTPENP